MFSPTLDWRSPLFIFPYFLLFLCDVKYVSCNSTLHLSISFACPFLALFPRFSSCKFATYAFGHQTEVELFLLWTFRCSCRDSGREGSLPPRDGMFPLLGCRLRHLLATDSLRWELAHHSDNHHGSDMYPRRIRNVSPDWLSKSLLCLIAFYQHISFGPRSHEIEISSLKPTLSTTH